MPLTCPIVPMEIERHVFDTPGMSALKMVANRYKIMPYTEETGLTLLLTHCIGGHKEQWEPVIESIVQTQCTKNRNRRIREVWAFDWQSHGDSAVLNHHILKKRKNGVSAFEWTAALKSFLRSHHLKGHRVIAIGHSAGAAAIILTTKGMPLHEFPYCAMILVEPTLAPRELFNAHIENRMALMDYAVSATSARRDTWKSREEAFRHFTKRLPWGSWDPRVVRLLTEYGLLDTPSGGVTLKCDRRLEAASYPDVEPHFEGAIQLGRICHFTSTHLIWGTRNDMVPGFIQDSLSDVSKGRVVSSVRKIEDSGHLIVQENPERLAKAICSILNTITLNGGITRSRL